MLILASASKARLELLESVGISPDKILNTNIDETPKKSEKPLDYVSRIALEKNKSVKKKKIEISTFVEDTSDEEEVEVDMNVTEEDLLKHFFLSLKKVKLEVILK